MSEELDERECRARNREWIATANEWQLSNVAFWMNAVDPHTFAAAIADSEDDDE